MIVVFIVRPDGSIKVRPVDHFSWSAGERWCKRRRKESSVNGHTEVPEKITHDHLDDLVASMRKAVAEDCYLPALWKLDVDSAFRRVPLHPDHRWAAAVTFMHDDKVC